MSTGNREVATCTFTDLCLGSPRHRGAAAVAVLRQRHRIPARLAVAPGKLPVLHLPRRRAGGLAGGSAAVQRGMA